MDILLLRFSGILDKRFIFHCLISSVGKIIVIYRDIVKFNGINCLYNSLRHRMRLLGSPTQSQDLDLMTLMGLFQLSAFCDYKAVLRKTVLLVVQ